MNKRGFGGIEITIAAGVFIGLLLGAIYKGGPSPLSYRGTTADQGITGNGGVGVGGNF